jgi:hypothetical protein
MLDEPAPVWAQPAVTAATPRHRAAIGKVRLNERARGMNRLLVVSAEQLDAHDAGNRHAQCTGVAVSTHGPQPARPAALRLGNRKNEKGQFLSELAHS